MSSEYRLPAELVHLFRELKAPAAARAFSKLAERARAEEWSYERFVEALLSTEVSSRESSGGRLRIRAARFPAHKTLEEFDFTFQRSVKKQVIEHLGQLDFLHAKDNVIMLGPPGTGKTHLAIALGIRACLAGQRVLFRTATEWVAALGDAQRQGHLDDELRRLERIPLLVCDEVGYIPFDPQAASLMFMLVSRRYERASLIVTSNKPFSAWGEIFGDDMAAVAMVDRLIHHAELISLKRRFLPAQEPRPRPPPRAPGNRLNHYATERRCYAPSRRQAVATQHAIRNVHSSRLRINSPTSGKPPASVTRCGSQSTSPWKTTTSGSPSSCTNTNCSPNLFSKYPR